MWRQGSVACNCLRSGLPFSEQNNTKLPTAKKATAFFWLPHGEWLGGQANFACGCGWNPRFKKGGSTFCWPPFLVWVKRILIHFFKHKNRPILEWCVSAHCHEKWHAISSLFKVMCKCACQNFSWQALRKIHKVSTGPSNSRSGLWFFILFWFFFVKSSYIVVLLLHR